MGFLGGVWETRRKGSSITKKSTPSMGDPKTECLELPVQLAGSSIEESSLHHDFFFTSSLNPGRSHMNDVKFLELPESYKFPVSFPCLLAPSLLSTREGFTSKETAIQCYWGGGETG